MALFRFIYNILWGDLISIPLPGGSTLGVSLLVLILGSAGVIGAVWSVAFARRAARQLPDRNEDFVLTERGTL